jgi:hypothetical protein
LHSSGKTVIAFGEYNIYEDTASRASYAIEERERSSYTKRETRLGSKTLRRFRN